ncbi:MAG: SRPBCC domain-containing protein [Tepidisphaeraceae bacterium]|jgi:activator of HSP90 ATPase
MTPTIQQSVHFPASVKELYDIYMDPRKHSAFTGGPVKISPKPGSKFDAFGGMLSGVTLAAIPGKLIVQRWRSHLFHATDPDSILILYFTQTGKRSRIDLAHVNVPKHDHKGVTDGWKKYYWDPLRKYLKSRK